MQQIQRGTQNANKRAGSGEKSPNFGQREKAKEVWAKSGCDRRGQWIFHGFLRPCSEIYIFGAKGEKKARKEDEEEGGGR